MSSVFHLIDILFKQNFKNKEGITIMKGINLLEKELLLDDKQIEMLAFAIKSQDIKNYINEHKKEYQLWLIQETTKEFYEKHKDLIYQKLKEKIFVLVKNIKIQKSSLALEIKS